MGVKLCKIVHECTITTVTVHICTVTVAYAFNILIIFYSLLFFSLFFICKTNPSSHVLSSSDTYTSTDTKSKINYKNKKSTTKSTKIKINHWNKIVGSVLMEIGDGLMEISVDGVLVMG